MVIGLKEKRDCNIYKLTKINNTIIYIFKTSVRTKKAVRKMTDKLNTFIPSSKWNFDLEDCDKILRVESREVTARQIIDFLNTLQFDCLELE